MKNFAYVSLLVAAMSLSASAGVLSFSARHLVKPSAKYLFHVGKAVAAPPAKAVAKGLRASAKAASYPFRHPRKTAKGVKKVAV